MVQENGVSWDKFQLAVILNIAITTLERMISMAPDRLPPFINLGTDKRARPIWLIETVIEWLRGKEAAGHGLHTPAVPRACLENSSTSAHAPDAATRGRGRPPKGAGIARRRKQSKRSCRLQDLAVKSAEGLQTKAVEKSPLPTVDLKGSVK